MEREEREQTSGLSIGKRENNESIGLLHIQLSCPLCSLVRGNTVVFIQVTSL